jgi:hypothetical protein
MVVSGSGQFILLQPFTCNHYLRLPVSAVIKTQQVLAFQVICSSSEIEPLPLAQSAGRRGQLPKNLYFLYKRLKLLP